MHRMDQGSLQPRRAEYSLLDVFSIFAVTKELGHDVNEVSVIGQLCTKKSTPNRTRKKMDALPVELYLVRGTRTRTWVSHFCERPGLAPGRTLRQSPYGLNSI